MDWKDYTEIAKKLNERYPKVPLALSRRDLKKMIVSLPDFTGDENDPESDFHVRFIRGTWISIRMPQTDHINDSAYI